ncbi:MAG TPA: phage tail tape measure protein [Candidatus Binataceae bacterium]|nr:phage tail tape measure protein [Candidatus Binataceae bacterium]
MAVKLFELGYVIALKGLAAFHSGMASVTRDFEKINEAVKSTQAMREFSANLGMMGGAALAAGGAAAGALYSVLKPAIESQAEWSRVQEAMNDGAATMKNLNEARETAKKIAAESVISETQLGEAYYVARSNMMSHAEALDAVAAANDLVIATTRNAADAQAQMAPTTRTLTTMHQLFGMSARQAADQMAALQTRYAELDISEVTYGLQYAQPVTKQTGMGVSQMEAALAMLSVGGLHGQEAGTAFREMIAKFTTDSKLQQFVRTNKQGGFDLAASLDALKSAMAGLSPLQQGMALKGFGFNLRDVTGVNILLGKVSELRAATADLDHSQGDAAKLAAIRMSAVDEQWAKLFNNLDLLRTAIGENLLPIVNRWIPKLISGLQSMHTWVEQNRGTVTMLLKVMAGFAAVTIPLGTIAVLFAGLSFITSYVPGMTALVGVIGRAGIATKVWTAAQWLLNAAMDANPIGLAIIGVAVLIGIVYELYKHWDMVKTFVTKMIPEAFHWGVNLLKSFASGIASAVMYPIHEVEKLAGRMGRFLIGHSPPPEGPLHELNLSKTIGSTLQPMAVLTSMRRLAAATAIAGPMLLGGAGSAGAAPAGITINYSVKINGGSPDEWARSAKRHADELMRIIGREMERRDRRSFGE